MAQILREQCRKSTSSVSGGWPSQKLEQWSTATLLAQDSPQMKDKVENGNAAAAVLRVDSWPWIRLSCLLLTRHYDMPSPKSKARFLQVSTQLLSILPWPPARQLPLRLSNVLGKLKWLSCQEEVASDWIIWPGELDCDVMSTFFWLAPLAKAIGLIVISWGSHFWWITWPGTCSAAQTLLNCQQPEW
jgi:hypothetical protein